MASPKESGWIAYSGEVWTDARGYAAVALPRSVGQLDGSLDYELRPFTHGVTAVAAAQFVDGRFTIETNEPHVKVSWRITGRRPASQQTHPQHEKGTT